MHKLNDMNANGKLKQTNDMAFIRFVVGINRLPFHR